MTTEETVTITETAPDGTETMIEITTSRTDETLTGETGESVVEEIIEAVFDAAADDGEYTETDFTETGYAETEIPSDTTFETSTIEETYTEPVINDSEFTPFAPPPVEVDSTVSTETETVSAETEDAEAAEIAAQEAHAEAAREAQEAADEFVAQGDYAAAAEARETAENEAWEAGDDNMLGSYDSTDLENAAESQEKAEAYNQQQAEFAQQGDYEAAREASGNAARETQNADWQAGGADHSGQAEAEETQMDWAVYHQDIAESNAQSAEEYAADGDFENAEIYAESAAESQTQADYYGDLGEHGGDMAVYDPSSAVETGGTYDSPADDYSTDYSTE